MIHENAWTLYGKKEMTELEKLSKGYMDFLDNGNTSHEMDLHDVLKQAKEAKQYKNIETKYFFCTFYKKGTAHLLFKDMDLLEKFNMFAAQRKGWLPPQYGRKRYHDMSKDEKHVVDSFQGQKKYEEVMARADYFLTDGANPMMLLGAGV